MRSQAVKILGGGKAVILSILIVAVAVAGFSAPALALDTPAFPTITNTQPGTEQPPTPEEAAALFQLPEGFQLTLFAGEPDVSQPIGMETDDRGRLWVAECYTYGGRSYDETLRDRIVILQDTDGDGRHDVRKVFWDQGDRLTSVLPGTNGCWILNSGTLAWLDDKDGDDRADGPPRAVLDGFDINQVGHNIVSGLMYGPTGWIYGRHGIQATSYVGAPGTPPVQRVPMNCSIWRYHPLQKKFELVTEGTTNPWGLDYNQYGDFFFTNNVIGHAWHAIPGAHFRRMYGSDFNPHYYELIDQHADHYHWDHSASWTDSRDSSGIHGELGGGHSHCGGLIYQGDNWPEQFRGRLMMCNTHGRRVNVDHPVRFGAGYKIVHQQDILKTSSKWFRGVSLVSGADGEVYLSDWTDEGECHDSDGVHRTSGRVYRITYGKPGQHFQGDLAQKTNEELWKLQEHSNNWYARHARRILLDRQPGAEWFSKHASAISWSDSTLADLQRMWIGISLGSYGVEDLNRFLDSNNEYVRSWGPRILCEQQKIEPGAWQKLIEHARHESSAYVRLSLASAVRRMPLKQRIEMAHVLAKYPEDAEDHDARLLLWYGLEMAVAQFPAESLELTSYKSLGKVPSFIARRLMHESIRNPEVASQLAVALTHAGTDFQRTSLLTGMVEGSRGVRKLTPPKQWDDVVASLGEQDSLKPLVQELMIVYGDGRAFEELIALVRNNDAVGIDRIGALKQLAERDAPGLLPVLKQGINDRVIAEAAVTALAQYDDPEIPQLILRRYRSMKKPEQSAALETLCSRPQYAQQLLEAMSRKELGEVELSASQARQIHQFNDQKLTTLLESVWGTLAATPADKQRKMEDWKGLLTASKPDEANLSAGRTLFEKSCGTCHRLFDQGKELAPDLTGGNRMNLDYLLENIASPSSIVPNQYKMTTFVLESGRVLNGVIRQETEETIVIQTEKEEIALPKQEIEESRPSNLSLMPEGLMDRLSPEEIRNLIAYLQSPHQVEREE